ncbi:hypothetical protein [Actinotalea caeni]|uniref:hypothetical protein n=1 Tax=Actinotalea caeni TaxID=1348467 RepID=UPI0012E0F65F|nr:hypothetical protein [Actinotalea caeni]
MGWMDRFRKRADSGDRTPPPRGSGEGPPTGNPGAEPFDEEDRARVVAMVRQEFARLGRELVPDGAGVLRGIDGRAFGLTNVEATLRRTPREHWPEVVSEFARIMNASIDAPGPRSLAQVRDRLYLRLRSVDGLPRPPEYGEPVLPGIVPMVAVDHPEHIEEVSSIDNLGSWEEIRALALANIRALPAMSHHPITADDSRADATIHVFDTDDYFGPSRVLVLPDLLERIGAAPSTDVVAVVPNRHVAAIHPIAGPGTVMAVRGLVGLARSQYEGAPGALSPHVYFLGADGRRQQLTDMSGEQVAIRVDGAAEESFARHGVLGG